MEERRKDLNVSCICLLSLWQDKSKLVVKRYHQTWLVDFMLCHCESVIYDFFIYTLSFARYLLRVSKLIWCWTHNQYRGFLLIWCSRKKIWSLSVSGFVVDLWWSDVVLMILFKLGSLDYIINAEVFHIMSWEMERILHVSH